MLVATNFSQIAMMPVNILFTGEFFQLQMLFIKDKKIASPGDHR
ncbi:hypothetical protein ESCAB7627_3489 [Escherichia albertii TW07627]|uniref:Uncharacterized protein n=1 Tax=Escherichia albertii (strain TW07627) TaxID=502347 RepID=A0ABC9NKD7_ESCAT|nr:hypothetical protein ESCAB7627_3489 [Escherichia albertii TW07627]